MVQQRNEVDWRELSGAGERTPPPFEQSRSEGDLSRNSYRRSRFPRLATRAVVNDDGTPITGLTDARLQSILEAIATLHGLLTPPEPEAPARATPSPLFDTGKLAIPGIGAASAYAAGDAFGDKFNFTVPEFGSIENAFFYDVDDEGIAKTLALFSEEFTATADNSALSISDSDLMNCLGHVEVEAADFRDFGASRIATLRLNPPLHYHAPQGRLYCQLQTQGADNIAAAAMPQVRLVIRPLGGA